MSLPKLLIIGHMRHGKDTFADILVNEYGFRKKDSSRASAEIFLFDLLQEKYGYKSIEDCYADRVNHRAEWHNEIKRFNTPDKTRLARAIMQENDIYVGMRSREEIEACKLAGIFDAIIWVDASLRKPPEPRSSFDIDMDCADAVVDNNGSESELFNHARRLLRDISRRNCFESLQCSIT